MPSSDLELSYMIKIRFLRLMGSFIKGIIHLCMGISYFYMGKGNIVLGKIEISDMGVIHHSMGIG